MKWFPAIVLGVAAAVAAAAQAPPSTHLPGTVSGVNAQAGQITVKTEKGDLTFSTTEKTQILHALPGVADPKQWTKITVADVTAGDEVVVYFRGSADQNPLIATALVVRTKSDLGQMAAKELEDWKKRGTTGVVSAVDPAAKSISLKIGMRTVTLQANEKTSFHRYSPDSAAAADAKPSTLADVKVGDQLKVLGNRTPDGVIAAEVVYAGTFRQIPALIVSIDPATHELKVTDLDTKKPLLIRVTGDTTMKKLPEQMAQMLAQRFSRGRGEGRGGFARGGGQGQNQAQGEGQGQGPGPGRFAGRGGRGDLNSMLDGLPALQLADLKPKDAIMVTTTLGSDPAKVTATFLLAGVEDVLRAAPTATRDLMGNWNVSGGGGEGQ
jgi:Domain of unknown function (DUF5666)